MLNKLLKMASLVLVVFAVNLVFALNVNVKEGFDYKVIGPVNHLKNGKVQITEFIMFNCIHCSQLEPLLEKWMVLPVAKNVQIKKIHVALDGSLIGYAKLNATIQAMNLQKLYIPVFDAVINQRQNLEDTNQLKLFLKANKVDTDKFMAMYNSFAIDAKAKEAVMLTGKYNVSVTPTIIVDDSYLLNPAQPSRIIEVIDYLVKNK